MITDKEIDIVKIIHKTIFGDNYPEILPTYCLNENQNIFVYFSPDEIEILNSYMIDMSLGFDIVKGKIKKQLSPGFLKLEEDTVFIQDGIFYIRIFKNDNNYNIILNRLKFYNTMNDKYFNYNALLDRINKIVQKIEDVVTKK